MEGKRDWRCPLTGAQGDQESAPRHATGQDPQGLREPLQWVVLSLSFPNPIIQTRLIS